MANRGVFVNNLDDFLLPSQACVNPLVAPKLEQAQAAAGGSSRVVLTTDDSISEFSLPEKQPDLIRGTVKASKTVATVSLNDCLACSGCVTTAESVLIQEQGYEKLLRKLELGSSVKVVVAISPNSRASVASFLGISSRECFLRIASVLKSMGVHYVVDTSSAGDVALVESREEFLHRYKSGRNKQWKKPATTTASSSTTVLLYDESNLDNAIQAPSAIAAGTPYLASQTPVLASNCPGWICYAEKTQPNALPYVSTVKSSQQILGAIFKRILFAKNSIAMDTASNSEVFLVSVQPCFDKKLEASRKDFYDEALECNEMDLVLSTTELWQLLELQVSNRGRTEETVFGSIAMDVDRSYSNNAEESLSTSSCTTVLEFLRSIPMDSISGRDSIEAMFRSFSASGEELVMAVDSNAGSGGYAEYIFKYAASSLYGLDLWNIPLDYKEGRNPDMTEVDINLLDIAGSNEGSRALKFARAYGFRNIQSIMLKLRRGTCDYDYVEIMACPSGCNNGGGQLKAIGKETPSETKERVQEVEKEYHTTSARKPDDSPLVKYIYNLGTLEYIGADSLIGKSLGLHPLSDEVRSLFHTRYHAVPKLEVVAPLAAKW